MLLKSKKKPKYPWDKEKRKSEQSHFLVPTCRKNSSISALVQRECSAQGFDGWLMSAVWSNRESALGLSILLEKAWFLFLWCPASQANRAQASVTLICLCVCACCIWIRCSAYWWPLVLQHSLNYRSCCCKQAFIALTCSKWEDMSVDSTISITSERSSLQTKTGRLSVIVDLGLWNEMCEVKTGAGGVSGVAPVLDFLMDSFVPMVTLVATVLKIVAECCWWLYLVTSAAFFHPCLMHLRSVKPPWN